MLEALTYARYTITPDAENYQSLFRVRAQAELEQMRTVRAKPPVRAYEQTE